MEQSFIMINQAFSACSHWFVSVWTASGAVPYYLAFIFILLVYRFILTPIFGSAGSDKVTKRREVENE